MTVPYQATGRSRQKQRTWQALVAATRELLAGGSVPAVEDVAEAAGVSRTTAYRYFPNRRALLVAAHPEIETASLVPPGLGDDAALRLDAVVEAIAAITLDTEPQQRATLRLALEATPEERAALPLRQGRRIRWIEDALEPVRPRLGDAEWRRLVHAVGAAVGIDALVWLVDVAGLPREECVDLMRWSARALLEAALSS